MKTSLTEAERTLLIDTVLKAQQKAYAPYSNFHVGAALLLNDGQIITGANVENGSFGLTICAERVAVSAAVTSLTTPAGKPSDNWRLLAIASRGGVTPCGACRQFLMEFAPELELLLVDSETHKTTVVAHVKELMPAAFTFESHPSTTTG